MLITNSRLYDRLKFLAQVFLPALGAAYFSLAGIWGLPSAEEVVGTIVIVDTFLGTVLQISSSQYPTADGEAVLTEGEDGKKNVSLEFDEDPSNIDQKKELRLKVVKK